MSRQEPPPNHNRRFLRIDHQTSVTVLLADTETAAEDSGRFMIIRGWSRDISPTGIRFICHSRLPDGPIFLKAKSNIVDLDFIEARIVRAKSLPDGLWEYGVELEGRSLH
jgi:hypothetical protein